MCQTIRIAELSGAALKLFYCAPIFTLKIGENQDFMSCRGKYFYLFHNILDPSSIISNVYWLLFPWAQTIQGLKLTTHLHVLSTLRKWGYTTTQIPFK
jgi:hypothetical protein